MVSRGIFSPSISKRSRNSPVERAAEVFERFNGHEATSLERVRVKLSGPLVRIGEVPELHYLSDKEGELVEYFHRVDRPGVMYADPDGGFCVIVGGSTRIVGKWLEENPKLSDGNIRRAFLSWKKLSVKARRKIEDPYQYVMGLGWKLQRARLVKFGHR